MVVFHALKRKACPGQLALLCDNAVRTATGGTVGWLSRIALAIPVSVTLESERSKPAGVGQTKEPFFQEEGFQVGGAIFSMIADHLNL